MQTNATNAKTKNQTDYNNEHQSKPMSVHLHGTKGERGTKGEHVGGRAGSRLYGLFIGVNIGNEGEVGRLSSVVMVSTPGTPNYDHVIPQTWFRRRRTIGILASSF